MKIASAIYYFALHVKGAGAFPPPLSAEREAELLEKSRNGDDGARNIFKALLVYAPDKRNSRRNRLFRKQGKGNAYANAQRAERVS